MWQMMKIAPQEETKIETTGSGGERCSSYKNKLPDRK